MVRKDRAGRDGLERFDLDAFLPYQLATAADAVSRALAGVYGARFDVTVPEWRLVANLGRGAPLSASELAERSSLDKPAVTRALQSLLVRGLITRAIADEDRRQVRIALTTEGEGLYREIAALALTWEADVLGVLSADERSALERALKIIKLRLAETT